MISGKHWHRLRAALLLAVILVSATNLPGVFSGGAAQVAEATVAQEKNRDQKDNKDKSNGDDEDHVLNGQVMEIDTLKDPPELVVGSVDGLTVIRMLKTDEIAISGVRIGDTVEARGEKIHEQLFEATELSVSGHYTEPTAEDKDSDKGKKKN